MMNMKRIVCLLLTVIMLLGLFPAGVIAQEQTDTEKPLVETIVNIFEMSEEEREEKKSEYATKGDSLWLNSVEEINDGVTQIDTLPDWGFEFYAWLEQELDKALDGTDSLLVDPYADYEQINYPETEAYKDIVVVQWFKAPGISQMSEKHVKLIAEGVYTAFLQDRPDAFWFNRQFEYTIDGDYFGFIIYGPAGVDTVKGPESDCVPTRHKCYIHSPKYATGTGFEGEPIAPIILVDEIKQAIEVFNSARDTIMKGFTNGSETLPAPLETSQYYDAIHYFYWLLITQNAYNRYVGVGNGNIRKWANLDAWKAISVLVGNTGFDGPACNGYAAAFKVLCDKVGIPCVMEIGPARGTITDKAGNEHIWNYVNLDDGKGWYLVDLTWSNATTGHYAVMDEVKKDLAMHPFTTAQADRRYANSIDGFAEVKSVVNTGLDYEAWFMLGRNNAPVKMANNMVTLVLPTSSSRVGHGLLRYELTKGYENYFYWNGLDSLAPEDYVPTDKDQEGATPKITLSTPTEDETVGTRTTFGLNVSFKNENVDLSKVMEAGVLVFDHSPLYYNVHTAKQTIALDKAAVADGDHTFLVTGINRSHLRKGAEVCVYFRMSDYSIVYSNVERFSEPCQHEFANGQCKICTKAEAYCLYVEEKQADGTYTYVNLDKSDHTFVMGEVHNGYLGGELKFINDKDCRVSIITSDNSAHYKTIGTMTNDDTMVSLYSEQIRQKEDTLESSGLFVPANTNVTLKLVEFRDTYLMLGYDCLHSFKTVTEEATCKKEGKKYSQCFKCGLIKDEATIAIVVHEDGEKCVTCADPQTLYLYGCINGSPVGTELDIRSVGDYPLTENELILPTFEDCYVSVKTGDNSTWYIGEKAPVLAKDGKSGEITLKKVTDATRKTYMLRLPKLSVIALNLTQADETIKLHYEIIGALELDKDSDGTIYTCNTEGELKGTKYQSPVSETPHRSVADKTTQEQTCTAERIVEYTCSVAGCESPEHNMTKTFPARGHVYVYEPVNDQYKCLECEATKAADCANDAHVDQVKVVSPTCMRAGYTRHECTACGKVWLTDMAPVAHDYVDGICTVCENLQPEMPQLSLKYPSLNFEDVIRINVYLSVSQPDDIVELGLLTFSKKQENYTIYNADAKIPGYVTEYNSYFKENLYRVSTLGIAPKRLADTLQLMAYARLSDGTIVYSQVAPYSALTYAQNILAGNNRAEMKQLVTAMLNYAAKAQEYFAYGTDAQGNSTITVDADLLLDFTEDMVKNTGNVQKEKAANFEFTGGYAKRYPTVSFEGAFAINCYCKPSNVPDGDVILYYWDQEDYDNASVLTKENATAAIRMNNTGTGEYHAAIDGVAAKDLERSVYVAFGYEAAGKFYGSGVLAYSIGTYLVNEIKKNNQQLDLNKAVAIYGYCAKQYFADTIK